MVDKVLAQIDVLDGEYSGSLGGPPLLVGGVGNAKGMLVC